ncbi:cellulase family glycosylhydrolase [Hyalangium rubrum]|uniref:mannan endo-1,4-beta-mannosidase n=1 Tax=Hyalangium rubrum TaxID=3103134 RepID=A0ABU5HDX6_9BACT|nr:cellulase family glycosylhydrolase [Hyalangium sp. s54d21]MDY7231662.1 cellulase family glycosylhydrolase [Hyalangium sp. s54d21]
MRSRWVLTLMLLTACGEDLAEQLEAEASDCEVQPAVRLGEAPSTAVFLNAYYLQEEATRALRQELTESPVLEETFSKAVALGAWGVRTSGFNDARSKQGDSAIQLAPGVYDETSFRGLDWVLTRAAHHGVKLVLTLGNYWDAYGGARQYVEWAGLPAPQEGDSRFFTERAVIEHYKRHVTHVLSRVNTFDGIRYGEHPSVLAWELLNEPRGVGLDRQGEAMRAWVDEVAEVVHTHAPGHRVGTGEEGFDVSGDGYDAAFWGLMPSELLFGSSVSFRRNTASPLIDFGGAHFYPELWGIPSDATARAGARWISDHAALARELGKPMFLGEFGLRNQGDFSLEERRALYRGWLRCAWRAGVGGLAPWMFSYDSRPDAWDAFTFYYRDGTAPEHPSNRYADLVIEATGRTGER